jgi:tRNA A37 threonylcarbamoyladenosine biosynthesis protein TsaE
VIEWAEKIRDILPAKTLFISMRYIDENTREMILEGPGEKIRKLEQLLDSGGSISWR